MLILRRRPGESLVIDGDIEIEILETGPQVKLGIRAPRHVTVLRKEVAETAERNRAASEAAPRVDIERLAELLRKLQ